MKDLCKAMKPHFFKFQNYSATKCDIKMINDCSIKKRISLNIWGVD